MEPNRNSLYVARVGGPHLKPNEDIILSLSPLTGDPDMYVTLDDSAPTASNHQVRLTPSLSLMRTSSCSLVQYAALGTEGEETLVFSNSDPTFKQFCSNECNMRIAIRGYSASMYSLAVSQTGNDSTATRLEEGIPQHGFAPMNDYIYYSFLHTSPSKAITFTLTPLEGDPDMFISTTTTRPTLVDHHSGWASLSLSEDEVGSSPLTSCV